MKEKLKRNYKLIVGIIIGVIVSLGSTYAVTTISSSDISYDNSTSGLTSTDMKGAIDELNEKAKKLSSNKPCRVIKGTGMDANDEIKCGTEEFYVMGTTGGDSIVTLTKYPIEGGSETATRVDQYTYELTEIINPSYTQNKQCGNLYFRCWGSGFANNYKDVLEKIGLSDSIEVKKPSLSDLNKLGCEFSTNLDYLELSGSCEKFPWLSWVVLTDRVIGPSSNCVAHVSGLSYIEPINGSGAVEKLMVTIPIKDILL